jgi:NAD-dependent deacetylase
VTDLRFKDFERIVFFTGAGMSAESGIPTYRGAGGIWREYNYEDYACQRAFDADPEKVWDFHDKRREKVASCDPNRGHAIVADIQAKQPSTIVVTQNIDGLHQRAGAKDVRSTSELVRRTSSSCTAAFGACVVTTKTSCATTSRFR